VSGEAPPFLPSVAACIPSTRGLATLPVLFAIATQTRPPDRILVADASPVGLGIREDDLGAATCNFLGVEVARHPAGTHQAILRRALAHEADTEWLFYVDDDVLPYHDCLVRLAACAQRTRAALVAGQKYDVLPRERSWGPQGTWSRCNDLRPNDVRVPFCDSGLMLVKRLLWTSVNIRYQEPSHDIIHTAQVCMGSAGGYCAAGAVGLHLRPSAEGVSGWAKHARDRDWLDAHLLPHLPPPRYAAFLAMIGVA